MLYSLSDHEKYQMEHYLLQFLLLLHIDGGLINIPYMMDQTIFLILHTDLRSCELILFSKSLLQLIKIVDFQEAKDLNFHNIIQKYL